jgi:iron complex outermembrane receptor protein
MRVNRLRTIFAGFLIGFFISYPAFASDLKKKQQRKILKMDIEQLLNMDVKVSSVSKRPQPLHKTASAVYVVTQEDIQRVGAVNIMEALRIVPGVLVSKINQNRYAISIRGFNRRLGSDKLLVLMDGRTLYSPSAAGVFWIGQDTVMEDIDRIEVIRGPGAALWGSNAVAGVINIITKDSKKTNGLMLSGGAGSEELGFATLRYGGQLTQDFNYRVYGKYRAREEGKSTTGQNAIDDKEIGQGGFRADWQPTSQDLLTFQGDYYDLNAGLDFPSRFVSFAVGSAPFRDDTTHKGANFLSRWTRKFEDKSSIQFQAYYDRLQRISALPFDNAVDQLDLDFQHNLSIGNSHNVAWGVNYRYSFFDFEQTNILTLPNDSTNLFGFFIHDEIALTPNKFSLIVGTKVEHNPFTGFEFQPNIRASWFPEEGHTLWAAFSRAIRLPSMNEEKVRLNRALVPIGVPAPALLLLEENKGNLEAEELLAYELGYRWTPNSKFSMDLTTYFFQYSDLIELTSGTSFTDGFGNTVLPFSHDNGLDGDVYGVELALNYKPFKKWRISASYAFNEVDLRPTLSNVVDPRAFNGEGDIDAEGEPNQIFSIRSFLDLPHDLQLDTMFYHVTKNKFRNVPAYSRLDVRLGWSPMEHINLSIMGQNLLDESHSELNELLEVATETERSFYVKATLNY